MGRARVCDVLVKRRQCFFLPDPKAMVKVALVGERSVSQNIRVCDIWNRGRSNSVISGCVGDSFTPWDSSTVGKAGKFQRGLISKFGRRELRVFVVWSFKYGLLYTPKIHESNLIINGIWGLLLNKPFLSWTSCSIDLRKAKTSKIFLRVILYESFLFSSSSGFCSQSLYSYTFHQKLIVTCFSSIMYPSSVFLTKCSE